MTTTHWYRNRFLYYTLILLLNGLLFYSYQPVAYAQCGPVDVAFVIDDTASMGGALNSFKAELGTILDNIQTASGGDYRLALVTFKDNITIRETFTAGNRDSIAAKVQTLTPEGGNNVPEASDEALNTVINGLAAAGRPQNKDFSPPFRAGSFKMIILITDAMPGGFDDTYKSGVTDVRAHQYALQAAANSIKISAIYVPTFFQDTPIVKPIMQDYATTTAGFYLETAQDGSGTSGAIKTVISACGTTTTVPVTLPVIPSDDKPGSVLFFNLYASDISSPAQENTRLTITNLDDTSPVTVHLFFIDGDTGNMTDTFLCIQPTRHVNLFASDYDPGIKGYALAVAVSNLGCPINFNRLIGGASIKLKSGHQGYLNALSFAAVAQFPSQCDDQAQISTLKFDGVSYDFSPRVLAIDNFSSPVDGTQHLLIINKFGGDITVDPQGFSNATQVGTIGTLSAVFYNDAEKAFNVTLPGGTPQQRNLIRDGYPRIIPALSKIITAGHSGWMRFSSNDNNSIVGASLSYNPKTLQNGAHNLRQVALMDSAKYTLPFTTPTMICR